MVALYSFQQVGQVWGFSQPCAWASCRLREYKSEVRGLFWYSIATLNHYQPVQHGKLIIAMHRCLAIRLLHVSLVFKFSIIQHGIPAVWGFLVQVWGV